jgi:REP element-mobilizing transposase RayT
MSPSDPTILAYFITWTRYGTWLPGDFPGWIKKNFNGVQRPNVVLEQKSRARMAEDALELTDSQRSIIEKTIRDHCTIRNWNLHAVNARTNHVHVVVTAAREPDEVMNQFKAWCSRKLSDAAGLAIQVAKKAGRRHWFTEDGDKQIIDNEEFLRNAIKYVLDGQ